MTIINIRGSSGSGKSTLVHRYLEEHNNIPVLQQWHDWKKPKVVGYWTEASLGKRTFIVGSYKTQCGGCDAMSYKGSHDDIESLIRQAMDTGNVIFEGLTISSTLSRWQRISADRPGMFWWAFMTTPEEECHRRILARNGGREPKRDEKGLADYQKKYRGCMRHMQELEIAGEQVVGLTSDDYGYEVMLKILRNE